MISASKTARTSRTGKHAWRRFGPVLLAVGMLVGLVGPAAQAATAPGNLPAPLGQATNTNSPGSLGCPLGANWKGFDANASVNPNPADAGYGPVAVAIQPAGQTGAGRVWVSDFRNSETKDSTAGKLFSWPNMAAVTACTQPDRELDGLNQPEGITFDSQGNMYLAITGDSFVAEFSPTLLDTFNVVGPGAVNGVNVTPTKGWATGAGTFPRGVAVGPDAKLYVANDSSNKILVYDPAGTNGQTPGVISSTANICHPKAVRFIGTSLFVVNYHQNMQCGTVPQVVRLDSQALTTTATANATFTDTNAIDMTSFGTTLVVSSTDGNLTTFPTATTGTGVRPAGTTVTSLGQNGVTGTYDLKGSTFGVATLAADGNPTLVADGGGFRVLQVSLTPPTAVKIVTTTAIASSKNPSAVGENVTFTATVDPATGTTTPTGTVQFKVDGTALGGAIALATGPVTQFSPHGGTATSPGISTLTAGAHSVTADYSGNAVFAPSQGTLQQLVTNVRVTSGLPLLVQPNSTDPIANITLAELVPGALPMGTTVCVGGTPLKPATAAAPTVTATGGNGTAGAVTSTMGNISFPITKTSTTATTYTLSGITTAVYTPGPIFVSVGTACNQAAPDLATGLQPGFVGTEKRLAGSTRYSTAEIIADTVEPLQSPAQPSDCKGTVIVANGVNYPDALAASSLAGTSTPILLVADTVPTETAAAIRQHGVNHIIIVGGPNSVSNAIEAGFANQSATTCGGGGTTANKITTERVAGADRYATAKAVSERNGLGGAGTAPTAASPTCTPVKSAIVASGEVFPDALAAGVLAGGGATCNNHNGGALPLLLTQHGSLDIFTQQALADLGITQVFLVGGTSTVSNAVLGQIQNVGGTNHIVVKRIAGSTRQGTAVALASVMGTPEFSYFGFQADLDRYSGELLLTRGDTFPDALVGAPLGAQLRAPLLLTDSPTSLGTTATTEIPAYPRVVTHLLLLGGPDSLSQAVFNAAGTAMASNHRVPAP